LHDLLQNGAMDEIAPGIRHWNAVHPNLGVEVSAYWLPELRLLLDPIAVPDEVEDVDHILLSCRHHTRDSLEAAERLGATVSAPRTGMHDYPDDTPIQPYDFGEPLLDGAVTTYQVGGLSPDETALHVPAANALSVADGAIRYGEDLGFVPDQYMDDPDRDKADLKRGFGRLAERLDFDVLLLAHGKPYPSGGREALRRFAEA
jgi:glyoxylase-like metal-dependent hydrolase (beta-lactamase superfamily II)